MTQVNSFIAYCECATSVNDIKAYVIGLWARRNVLATFETNKDNIEPLCFADVFFDSLGL
jgi:hypothetical protein